MFETQKETDRFGPTWSQWALIVFSVLASPVVLAMVLITAMERDYTYVSLLFPIPYIVFALSKVLLEQLPEATKLQIGSFLLGVIALLALMQFPAYAIVFAVTKRRETVLPALAVAHFLLAIAAYLTFVFIGS